MHFKSKKLNVFVIFGTRPEAIKMAPVILELRKHPDIFHTTVCVTAQHRDMLDHVLELFDIVPDHDLNIMRPGQDIFDITSSTMLGLRDIFKNERPDIVLVHGDTTTAMAATLASFYCNLPTGHIEAGLRTWNKYRPYPEEVNRKIVGILSELHFAPTSTARQNLLKEGVPDDSIYITGNTAIDALFIALGKLGIASGHSFVPSIGRRKILVTAHRRESFGEGLKSICEALKELALNHPDVDIIFPVHPNPNVRKHAFEILLGIPNISLMEPLEYLPFVKLMSEAYLILTDSGGIQEEAPSLGKPVLVMRDVTERPEAVEVGTVIMVGTDKKKIVQAVSKILEDENLYLSMSKAHNPYGDGTSAKQIVNILIKRAHSLKTRVPVN